jgi:predicted NUDIX family NTP pyrophosphohydrolase
MARTLSAGILLYRLRGGSLEVFLVHPGGLYWQRKDAGAWSIPKGELEEEGADLLATAQREFFEETGFRVSGAFISLTPLKQRSGKLIHAFAVAGDVDAAAVTSNTFRMEWPPRSGREQEFPEIDKGAWFSIGTAREKIVAGQRGFLDQLEQQTHPGQP